MEKKKQKKWVKKRHRITFALARGILIPWFRLAYGYKRTNDKDKLPKGPCLIMCNHQATMDQCFLMLVTRRPLYFIASEDLFTIPVVSRIIKYVSAPIPKTKSKSDLTTIKNTLKVLKEGGSVLVFPSGNRTLSGSEWEIDISIAKFAKLCKVPVVLYNVKGGYGVDPRWGGSARKGSLKAIIQKIISVDELENMGVDELYSVIKDTLVSDDYLGDEKYRGKNRAEFIERALYYCPNCKSFNTLKSEGDFVKCTKCGMTAEYTEDLKLKPVSGTVLGKTIKEWYDKQREILKTTAKEKSSELFFDEVQTRLVINRKREKLNKAIISANSDKIIVKATDNEYEINFKDKIVMTVLGKRKINFYLSDDKVLQILGSERFNAVKYLQLKDIYDEVEGANV